MKQEKPLHLRVAEALGWKVATHPVLKPGDWWLSPGALAMSDDDGDPGGALSRDHLPRYDTDWSVTGPLIETYGITVTCYFISDKPFGWAAGLHANVVGHEDGFVSSADTPLLAICELILALKESGRLKPVASEANQAGA